MTPRIARAAVLVLALPIVLPTAVLPSVALAADDGLGLKLQRTLGAPPQATRGDLPSFLFADRLDGIANRELTATGNAEFRRGHLSVHADRMRYDSQADELYATGSVRIERGTDVVTGPSLKYRPSDATGWFEQPEYVIAPKQRATLDPVGARGGADRMQFEGAEKYRLFGALFTTCKPGDDSWYMRVGEMELDTAKGEGIARDAKLTFLGVTLPGIPYVDFPLNNQRKSGLLPPFIGTSGRNGAEITLPYYFNLAPNYDATLLPRVLGKRGLQLGGEFRYMDRHNLSDVRAEVLPNDQVRNATRQAVTVNHNYSEGNVAGLLRLNYVSDDNYFRDLSSRLNIVAQTTLPREGQLSYSGSWWEGGTWTAIGRVQRFQTLQDPANPVPIPYDRAPQMLFSAGKQVVGGIDFNFSGEAVSFLHPTQVLGVRTTQYPSISLPLITPGGFLTPKVGVHSTQYGLDRQGAGVPDRQSRAVPIVSVDGGLVYERDVQFRSQEFVQTLEPRAYYVWIPYRDQSKIPVFDSALADFNYASIFSENRFAGGDRIGDANQITLATTSRLIYPGNGQELVRGTVGQRYYFRDQLVGLTAATPPTTNHSSDWIASLGGRLSREWSMDSGVQYNPRERRYERISLGARWQPGPGRVLNAAYRFLQNQVHQVDISGQWPVTRDWYAVARYNYSINAGRVVEGLFGAEYAGDCWFFRVVTQRFASGTTLASNTLFFQVELNGFSRFGSNPLEALKRNVPGYTRLNQIQTAAPVNPAFDFFD